VTTVSDISSKGEFEEAVNKLSQDLLIVGLFKQHKQLLTLFNEFTDDISDRFMT